MAGMLDAMGLYRVLHPVHTYRNLVSSEDCIQKTGVNAQQLAQGMAEYAKLKPSAFTPAGMSLPSVTIGLEAYFEFLCSDLFNQAAYDCDETVMTKYPIDPRDAR